MDRYLSHSTFLVVFVLVLVTNCFSIPLRSPRDVQDLIQLNDGTSIPIQDYANDDYNDADIHDDGPNLSALDEPGPHDLHPYHSFEGYTTENIDHTELAQKTRDDALIDITDSGGSDTQSDHLLDLAINSVGNMEENSRASDVDTGLHKNELFNFQELGHLSSSRSTAVHPTSESHSDTEQLVTTIRTNNSDSTQLSAERRRQPVNLSLHEEHVTYHGFLMVDNIQNTHNEIAQQRSNDLTSKLTTQHLTLTTTTQEQLTVKRLNISNQEQIARTDQRSIPVDGVIIRQSNEALDSESEDNTDRVHEFTEIPLSHHGQVPFVPREPHVYSLEDEEPELPHHVIDKGEHPHGEEHVNPGQPRPINNQSPSLNGNVPEVEPTAETPLLRIHPSPAQQEPQERNTSTENVETQFSVSHQDNKNEQTESYSESAGHTNEPGVNNGDSDHVNPTEESLVTAVEGHIEFITEDPGIHGDYEIKSNKHVTKHADEKVSSVLSSLAPSSYVFESESFTKVLDTDMTPSRAERLFTPTTKKQFQVPSGMSENIRSHLDVGTVSPHDLQSSALSRTTDFTEVTSSESLSSYFHLGSDLFLSSTSLLSSLPPVKQFTQSFYDYVSTRNFQDTPLASLSEVGSTVQQLDIPSTRSALSTNEAWFKGYSGGSSVVTIVAVKPSVSAALSVGTDQAGFSSTEPTMPVSDILTSSATSHFYSQPRHILQATPSLSLQPTPAPGFQVTKAAQSMEAPVSVSVMPSVSTTTKKKGEQNSTTTTSTTPTTRKKPDSGKGNDKPENPRTTSHRVRSSSQRTPVRTFPPTLLSMVHTTLSQKPDMSTPPSVYIMIGLRMDWNQFCGSKSQFISEIKWIVLTEKGLTVGEEQFKMNTENCGSANSLLDGRHIDIITIEMYIVDNDGKLDIQLTTVTSYVISKGFQKSNFLKDKIVSVSTVSTIKNERLPDSRAERKEAPPAVTMVIVIASVGGVCCVALIILQVLIHRRIKAKRKQRALLSPRASLQSMDHVALGVIPKSRPNSGYWNPALDNTIELPEPEEHSHILNFSGLANFCMDTKGIYAEFQTIPFDDVDVTSVPVGEEEKNRFANVLPHKRSRVSLKVTSENKQGYINANYINGYMEEKKVYIATQSPLLNTVNDFWRMVWEQQSRTILMLNSVTQHGKPKQSTCYWPDNLETECRREFGDYSVTLKKRDVQHDYIDCTLELMDIERNLKREIHHFWFTCWSDTGPPEPLTLVKFVLDTRPCFENSGCPVIVHCGPGTGRTGVYIAVDMCMRMFEDRRRVDILNCVHAMRSERAGAVQTKEQYNLIYQALNEYAVILSSPSISTRSSVITLHAML